MAQVACCYFMVTIMVQGPLVHDFCQNSLFAITVSVESKEYDSQLWTVRIYCDL